MRRLPAVALGFVIVASGAPAQILPGLGPAARRTEVDRGRLPWRALGRVQTEFAERCTGFMVAPALVATAAHCLYLPKVARFIRPHEVHFLLGEHLDTYVAHARAVRFEVPRGYDPRREAATARLDRAFITLDHPVALPDGILRFAPGLPPPGTTLMLGGYGQDRQERILADRTAICSIGRAACSGTIARPRAAPVAHRCWRASAMSGR